MQDGDIQGAHAAVPLIRQGPLESNSRGERLLLGLTERVRPFLRHCDEAKKADCQIHPVLPCESPLAWLRRVGGGSLLYARPIGDINDGCVSSSRAAHTPNPLPAASARRRPRPNDERPHYLARQHSRGRMPLMRSLYVETMPTITHRSQALLSSRLGDGFVPQSKASRLEGGAVLRLSDPVHHVRVKPPHHTRSRDRATETARPSASTHLVDGSSQPRRSEHTLHISVRRAVEM